MATYNRIVALAAAFAVLGLAGARNALCVEEVKVSCPSGKSYLDMSNAEYTACLGEEGAANLRRESCPGSVEELKKLSHREFTACLAQGMADTLNRSVLKKQKDVTAQLPPTENSPPRGGRIPDALPRGEGVGSVGGGPEQSQKDKEFSELSRWHYERIKIWAQEIADNLNGNVLNKAE